MNLKTDFFAQRQFVVRRNEEAIQKLTMIDGHSNDESYELKLFIKIC